MWGKFQKRPGVTWAMEKRQKVGAVVQKNDEGQGVQTGWALLNQQLGVGWGQARPGGGMGWWP